jgi:hypothetical protein
VYVAVKCMNPPSSEFLEELMRFTILLLEARLSALSRELLNAVTWKAD